MHLSPTSTSKNILSRQYELYMQKAHNQIQQIVSASSLENGPDQDDVIVRHADSQKIKKYLERYEDEGNKLFPSVLEERPPLRSQKSFLAKDIMEIVLANKNESYKIDALRDLVIFQKSSHLFISRSNDFENFAAKHKFPATFDSYYMMGLYLSKPQLFNEAVGEVTRLFSKVHPIDLTTRDLNPLSRLVELAGRVCYEKIPIYLVKENGRTKGKICLIGGEEFIETKHPHYLWTLARIFPLHLEIIKKVAKQLGMHGNENSLNKMAELGDKYLQIGYRDHYNWLELNRLSAKHPYEFIKITPKRNIELIDMVKKELLNLNHGINNNFHEKGNFGTPIKGFISGKPEKVAVELASTILPLIMTNLNNQILKTQEEFKTKLSGRKMKKAHLVSLRSPLIKRERLYEGVCDLIEKNPNMRLRSGPVARLERENIAEQLLYVVMQDLVRGKEIFFFDPLYCGGECYDCWIRY